MREITNSLGGFALASLELREAQQAAIIRHVDSRRIRDAIYLCDMILADLERHNLMDERRVRSSLRPALQKLFEISPLPFPIFVPGTSVRRTMDAMLDLQERLLELKGGSLRRQLREADEPLDAA
jgi:hypothetical protein